MVCTGTSQCIPYSILVQGGRTRNLKMVHTSNPFPKPIENDALSAKRNVHIWNRLRECYSRLYTGALKTRVPSSAFQLPKTSKNQSKNQFKIKWRRFAIGAFLKFLPIPSRNALRDAARRALAHQLELRVRKLSKSSISRFTRFTEVFTPLGSDNSHFFKWLFMKMAVSMVSDPKSEQELAESHPSGTLLYRDYDIIVYLWYHSISLVIIV